MIVYRGGPFGFEVLFRIHGSAAFKAVVPSMVSTGIYLVIFYGWVKGDINWQPFNHPYPMAAVIGAFTFLLTFKASFSYNRYWEACTAVSQMHSKWLDIGMEISAFHLQSTKFDKIRPPSFACYPEIDHVIRERERLHVMTHEDLDTHLDKLVEVETKLKSRITNVFKKKKKKPSTIKSRDSYIRSINSAKDSKVNKIPIPRREKYSTNLQTTSPSRKLDRLDSVAVLDGGMNKDEPSLFLQEAAHLLSLLSAVAFSTLRNDIEGAESPLTEFEPGVAWPPVDPDDGNAIGVEFYQGSRLQTVVRFLLGQTRNPKLRTLYNASRPFRVMGGVSDAEILLLQSARGPLAKVALCTMWLQEFIIREYLNGAFGAVHPPIISRLFQYTSDGMVGYNQARKVAYIPFPFPHNQLTAFFVLIILFFIPVLMVTFVENTWYGAFLNFFTVMCFEGLHEVARELEDPFRNVPNDIPLNNFQAQFNESLITMYAGFHPEAWWKVPKITDAKQVLNGTTLLTVEEDFETKGQSDGKLL